MYRSPPSSQDTHDDYVRTLLDQRSARADVHGRFSTISEYMDTPSVYSRPNFSPRTSDNGDQHMARGDYDYPSPTSPRSDGTHIHEQSSSMLDLDDDPRSSLALDEQLNYEGGNDGLDTATRISYLGPKMRFHSRAPWEVEGDALEEEDESDQIPRHFPPGYPFARSNGSKQDSSRSSSPRPSSKSRPSGESSRSHLPPKRSFDTINSQVSSRGALYALAQEGLSTHSLARATAPAKETLRSKFSFGRLRPEVPTVPLPPSPNRTTRFPTSPRGNEQQSFELPDHPNHARYANKNHIGSNETIHPYANPDLVVSYADDDESVDSTLDHSSLPRNDSSVTVTESYSTDSLKSSSRSTLTPDTSLNSIASKHRTSSILARNISSPVPVVGPPQRIDPLGSDNHSISSFAPTISSLPGWTERNTAPTFSLISLEEARAQRTRSSTVTVPSRISTSSGLSNSSAQFPSGDTDGVYTVSDSTTATNYSRARGRSISAGASKAKNAIQTIVGQPKSEHRELESSTVNYQSPSNTPSGKTLRHKKSGFMRLFNAGKMPEKEERSSPPPVPSLPDAVFNLQSAQRIPRSAVHRIPVPSLSPTLLEASASSTSTQSVGSPQSDGDSWKSNLSPRRTPPTLSINTVPHNIASRSSTSQMHLGVLERPWLNEQPQSAPAHVSEFPALRLRPVSTLFSAQFGDHIVTGDSRSSDETSDSDTPTSPSPNGLMSPITPAFMRNDEKIQISSSSTEDRASIKLLQEQLISSKNAWQRHIWELEGQVRDLKVELEEVKGKNGGEYCQSCGRGTKKESLVSASVGTSVVNRPRARTGTSSRFGNALP